VEPPDGGLVPAEPPASLPDADDEAAGVGMGTGTGMGMGMGATGVVRESGSSRITILGSSTRTCRDPSMACL
jgi:hypothetical protein